MASLTTFWSLDNRKKPLLFVTPSSPLYLSRTNAHTSRFSLNRFPASIPLRSHPIQIIYPTRRINRHGLSMTVGPPATNAISEGIVLEFQSSSGGRILGQVLKPNGKRNWIVQDARNVSHSITPKQVVYIIGNSDTYGLEDGILQLKRRCQEKLQGSEECLQVAWELLQSDDDVDLRNIELTLLSDLTFGATDPVSLYATHMLLSNDGIFFKERNIKGKLVYEHRSPQLVEASIKQKELGQKREEEGLIRKKAIAASYHNRSVEQFEAAFGEDEANRIIEILKDMAVETDNNPYSDNRFVSGAENTIVHLSEKERNMVKEVFEAIEMQILPSNALKVLVNLQVFSVHENLALYKSDLIRKAEFDEKLKVLADEMIANPPHDIDANRRRDFRSLRAYAVDSADTSEVDDAISWDAESSLVMVHIADPTRYLSDIEHPILQEAMGRVATLYLPTHKLTMFPENIATSLFSLDGIESDGTALTVSFHINDDGSLQEESIRIETSRISSPIRMTYEEVETHLMAPDGSEHDDLKTLCALAEKRIHWREMEGGAIIINSDFSDVKVNNVSSEEPEVLVGIVKTNTKSWLLVSELMITACNIAGMIASKEGIVLPFRGQEPFDYPEDEVLESVPDGPLRASMAFQNATPSEIKTEAIVHASLGLDEYVQMTSPIRRSSDIISHLQLKAHLRGEECPLCKEDIQKEIGRIMDIGRVMRKLETRTKKYWQYEFLRRNGPHTMYEGMYIRQMRDKDGVGFVHLEKYGFQVVANVPTGTKPGTKLSVKMSNVNPRQGVLRAEATLSMSESQSEDFDNDLKEMFSDVSDCETS